MTNTLTISRDQISVPREFLEVIANSSQHTLSEINAAIQQARTFLAAPAVERQATAYMYLERSEDGYEYRPLLSHKKWLVLPDGFYEEIPLYTSPPAPVAVDAEFLATFERVLLLFAPHDLASMQVLTDARACLDKVKEMNR